MKKSFAGGEDFHTAASLDIEVMGRKTVTVVHIDVKLCIIFQS